MLKKIFGVTGDKVGVTGDCRRLHNEELHDLYSSPIVIWLIKSRKMRWEEHIARMGASKSVKRVQVGKNEDPGPGVEGKIIFEFGIWRPGLD